MSQPPVFSTVEYHAHDEIIDDDRRLEKYACLCTVFCGGKRRTRWDIHEHMMQYVHSGMIPFSESVYCKRIQFLNMRDVEALNIDEVATNADEEAPTLDEEIEVDRVLNDGFNDD